MDFVTHVLRSRREEIATIIIGTLRTHAYRRRAMPRGWNCTSNGDQLCYASPPKLTSHAGCSAVCEQYALSTDCQEPAAAIAGLAYVGSQETSDFLVQHVLKGHRHWVGLHREPPTWQPGAVATQGTWTSWAAVQGSVQGSLPTTWMNWAPSQPDAALGREDCVAVDGLGRWHDLGCERPEYRCLCELGAQTRPSYYTKSAQLLAAADAEAWTAAAIALKAFVGVFVPAVLLMLFTAHRLLKQLQQRSKLSDSELGGSETPRWRSIQNETLRQMRLASSHYALQRLQSCSFVAWAGSMLVCGGFVPMVCQLVFGSWPVTTLGPYANYLPLVPIGGVTLGLALHPTDAAAIRAVARFLVLLWFALAAACARIARSYAADASREWQISLLWALFCPLNIGCAAALADGLRHCRYYSMPRLLLRRSWALGRFLCCSTGFLMGVLTAPLLVRDPVSLWQDPYAPGWVATGVCFVCIPLAMTPTVRDKARTWLGCARWGRNVVSSRVSASDSEQNVLAASLMKLHPSHSSPEECLEHAKRNFFCCTLDDGSLSESQASVPAAAARTVVALCSERCAAKFGSVDAFISHSQLDDEACKWERMRAWARSFSSEYQRVPTVWYDRVCIQEATAAENVAALPLMVLGCKQLVVLAGPTYSSRLWAMIEVLVFLWSQQGRQHDVVVLPLLRRAQETAEGVRRRNEAALLSSVRQVDLAAAACYCEEDRQWMLAAIESAFGTPDRFNTLLSDLLHNQCSRYITQERDHSAGSRGAVTSTASLLSALPHVLVKLILHAVAPRDRAVRVRHALVCRTWRALVRDDEILQVHLCCSPKGLPSPGVLPGFVHEDMVSCRIRVGVSAGELRRQGQRLARAVDTALLAHRSAVASVRVASIRLEDFKDELSSLLPELLKQVASIADLAAPWVHSSVVCDVHLVRCIIPPDVLEIFNHMQRLRIFDCQFKHTPQMDAFMSLLDTMPLQELCWGIWNTQPSSRHAAVAERLALHLPRGLKRLVLTKPVWPPPLEVWARVAPTLQELVLTDIDVDIENVVDALPGFVRLHTLQLPLAFMLPGPVQELLGSLPSSLTSLGKLSCAWQDLDPVSWLDALPADLRLRTLSIFVEDPGSASHHPAQSVAGQWDGESLVHACALERISHGLATRMPSLTRLFIEYFDEGSMYDSLANRLSGIPLEQLAQALEPLKQGLPPSGREVHLLRSTCHCVLVADGDGRTASLLGAEEASRALCDLLAPLRLTVHYEGSNTESCLGAPDWLLEDDVGLCPSLSNFFAAPRHRVIHSHPATDFPKLRVNDPNT